MTNKTSLLDAETALIEMTKQLLIESEMPYKGDIKMNLSLERHLGFDSLTRAELFQRVQKQFSVIIPDQLLARAETLKDIVDFLQTAPRLQAAQKNHASSVITSHGEKSFIDPTIAKSLTDILLLYAEHSPNKTHVYFQNESGSEEVITYGALLKSSLKVACSLRARGLREGETVAIMLPTHPNFFYAFFGTLLAGGIPIPIYPPFRMHMLEAYAQTEARILNNAEARMLITFEQAESLSRMLKAFVPSLKEVTTADELLKPEELSNLFNAQADDYAFIQYTSGSTADPKGVLLTHQNLLANIRAYGEAIKVTPDDVAVSWLPLYHDMGLIGMWLGSLYYGVPLILLTPFSFLNHPEKWLWAIHYHRGTLSGAPNFAYDLCVRKIDAAMMEGLDLSSWRMAANGAEKIYPRTLRQFTKKFAPYGLKSTVLLPMYGLAESTVALAIPPLERGFRVDEIDRQQFEEVSHAVPATGKNTVEFVSCGLPLKHHDIRIVDENMQVLPERFVGRLQFRGPSNMQGYYNNPKATTAIIHDGWIDSGDLAYLADHEVFITGRHKDLIVKAGRNLYPVEIEEVVGGIAGIRQGCVAAFGVNDEKRSTEQLIIVAETREKNKAKRDDILDQIRVALATTLDIVPDQIILVPPHTVLKTSSGKLQRAACKKLFLEKRLTKAASSAAWQMVKISFAWATKKTIRLLQMAGQFIYTIYVASMILITCLPIYALVRVLRREKASAVCRVWARFLLRISCCQVTLLHQEWLMVNTPVIYAANHASYIDAIILLACLPPGTRFVGKKELFSVPIIRTFMHQLNVLAIDRLDLSKGLEDTRQMEEVLKQQQSILIFPEGTFGYAQGLRPFRAGAFKIACNTNTAVCPIALAGTRRILRGDQILMQRGRVTVTVCKPIMPAGSEWQNVMQLRHAVRAEIAAHCGEPSLDFIAAQTVAIKPE